MCDLSRGGEGLVLNMLAYLESVFNSLGISSSLEHCLI